MVRTTNCTISLATLNKNMGDSEPSGRKSAAGSLQHAATDVQEPLALVSAGSAQHATVGISSSETNATVQGELPARAERLWALAGTKSRRFTSAAQVLHRHQKARLARAERRAAKHASQSLDVARVAKLERQYTRMQTVDLNAATTTTQNAGERGQLKKWQQGDESMYEANRLQERFANRTHENVKLELGRWWTAAQSSAPDRATGKSSAWRLVEAQMDSITGDHGEKGTLGRAEYGHMMNRIHSVLEEDEGGENEDEGGHGLDQAEMDALIEEAWQADTNGRGDHLTRGEFNDSLFELADLWTDSTACEEYCQFLRTLLSHLSHGGGWRPLDELTRFPWESRELLSDQEERDVRSHMQTLRLCVLFMQKISRGRIEKVQFDAKRAAAVAIQRTRRSKRGRKTALPADQLKSNRTNSKMTTPPAIHVAASVGTELDIEAAAAPSTQIPTAPPPEQVAPMTEAGGQVPATPPTSPSDPPLPMTSSLTPSASSPALGVPSICIPSPAKVTIPPFWLVEHSMPNTQQEARFRSPQPRPPSSLLQRLSTASAAPEGATDRRWVLQATPSRSPIQTVPSRSPISDSDLQEKRWSESLLPSLKPSDHRSEPLPSLGRSESLPSLTVTVARSSRRTRRAKALHPLAKQEHVADFFAAPAMPAAVEYEACCPSPSRPGPAALFDLTRRAATSTSLSAPPPSHDGSLSDRLPLRWANTAGRIKAGCSGSPSLVRRRTAAPALGSIVQTASSSPNVGRARPATFLNL